MVEVEVDGLMFDLWGWTSPRHGGWCVGSGGGERRIYWRVSSNNESL